MTKVKMSKNCNYVKTFWHLIWNFFCHLDGANSIKTDLQNCNLWTGQFAGYKSVNKFDWICHVQKPKSFSNQTSIFCYFNSKLASNQERNMKIKIIISHCGMQQRVCNFYQKEIATALTVHINVLLVLEFQNRNYSLNCNCSRKCLAVVRNQTKNWLPYMRHYNL